MFKRAIFILLFLSGGAGYSMDNRIAILVEKNLPTAFVGEERVIPYQPTLEQIQLTEKKLMAHLKSKHPGLFKKALSYYRQYSGLQFSGGKKIIRGNFMCKVKGEQWRKEWIQVDDGGDCYFNFTYELGSPRITEFSVNGES